MESNLSPPRVIFFDGYRTLLHAPDPHGRMRALLEARGHVVPEEMICPALNREMVFYRDNCHLGRDEKSLHELGLACAREFLQGLASAGSAPDWRLEETALLLREAFTFVLYDDVQSALRELQTHGTALAVISNFDCRLPQILDDLGLNGCFVRVFTSAALGLSKPDPRIFHHALEDLEVCARDAWHVGDQWDNDILPALDCGIVPVHLVRQAEDSPGSLFGPQADGKHEVRTIRSLEELPGLVQRATSDEDEDDEKDNRMVSCSPNV